MVLYAETSPNQVICLKQYDKVINHPPVITIFVGGMVTLVFPSDAMFSASPPQINVKRPDLTLPLVLHYSAGTLCKFKVCY